MTEELLLRLGLNTEPFARGLKSTIGIARSAATSIGSALKSGIGLALGAVSVGALTAFSKSAMQLGETIRTLSNELGVSTDFVQLWGLAAEKNNSTAEKAQRGMENLNTKLGQARQGNEAAIKSFKDNGIAIEDVTGKAKENEEVFVALIQKIKDTEDPSIRSAIAAEFFGKKLHELTEAAIDFDNVKASSKAEILSERDLETLHLANDGLEALWRRVKLIGAQGLASVLEPLMGASRLTKGVDTKPSAAGINETDLKNAKEYATALKAMREAWRSLSLVGASDQTRLVHLLSQRITLEHELREAQDGSIEKLKIQKSLFDKLKEAEELRLKMREDAEKKQKKRADDILKIEKEIAETQGRITIRKNQNATDSLSQHQPTLQELAQSGFWTRGRPLVSHGGFTPGPFARDAQSIMGLRNQATQDFIYGNTGRAKDNISEANKRYDRLAEMGIVSPRADKVDQATLDMEKHLADLITKKASILVSPSLAD